MSDRTHTKDIRVRLTEKERAMIEECAQLTTDTMAGWMRMVAVAEARRRIALARGPNDGR